MQSVVHLVRHGQVHNPDGILYGRLPGYGLSEIGRAMAQRLAEKGIPYELDVWGHDSAHDWPWWRKQIAHHLPRFC